MSQQPPDEQELNLSEFPNLERESSEEPDLEVSDDEPDPEFEEYLKTLPLDHGWRAFQRAKARYLMRQQSDPKELLRLLGENAVAPSLARMQAMQRLAAEIERRGENIDDVMDAAIERASGAPDHGERRGGQGPFLIRSISELTLPAALYSGNLL